MRVIAGWHNCSIEQVLVFNKGFRSVEQFLVFNKGFKSVEQVLVFNKGFRSVEQVLVFNKGFRSVEQVLVFNTGFRSVEQVLVFNKGFRSVFNKGFKSIDRVLVFQKKMQFQLGGILLQRDQFNQHHQNSTEPLPSYFATIQSPHKEEEDEDFSPNSNWPATFWARPDHPPCAGPSAGTAHLTLAACDWRQAQVQTSPGPCTAAASWSGPSAGYWTCPRPPHPPTWGLPGDCWGHSASPQRSWGPGKPLRNCGSPTRCRTGADLCHGTGPLWGQKREVSAVTHVVSTVIYAF